MKTVPPVASHDMRDYAYALALTQDGRLYVHTLVLTVEFKELLAEELHAMADKLTKEVNTSRAKVREAVEKRRRYEEVRLGKVESQAVTSDV